MFIQNIIIHIFTSKRIHLIKLFNDMTYRYLLLSLWKWKQFHHAIQLVDLQSSMTKLFMVVLNLLLFEVHEVYTHKRRKCKQIATNIVAISSQSRL